MYFPPVLKAKLKMGPWWPFLLRILEKNLFPCLSKIPEASHILGSCSVLHRQSQEHNILIFCVCLSVYPCLSLCASPCLFVSFSIIIILILLLIIIITTSYLFLFASLLWNCLSISQPHWTSPGSFSHQRHFFWSYPQGHFYCGTWHIHIPGVENGDAGENPCAIGHNVLSSFLWIAIHLLTT